MKPRMYKADPQHTNPDFLFVRGLTPRVKRKFKATVARRGDVMTEVVEALMLAYVARPHNFEDQLDRVKLHRKAIRDAAILLAQTRRRQP